MGKPSKKGRITGGQRKEINQRTVADAIDGDMDDIEFARVIRHLGNGHVRIILANKQEGIARIRTVLTKRGSTPIAPDDIVVVSGRDFETKATEDKTDRFDLLGVMTRTQSAKLEKTGRIPPWFIATLEGGGVGCTGTKEAEEDIFDFTETRSEETDDSDFDISKI